MRNAALALISLAVAACSGQDATSPRAVSSNVALSRNGPGVSLNGGDADDDVPRGVVYTLTNSAAANAVRAFSRGSGGTLTFVADYATGGTGTGGGLGNQGALAFARDGRFLIAVSPGSNQLSSFRITRRGLELANTVGSGGLTPVSVTSSDKTVYVLNAGGTGNIAGFHLNGDGRLTPIAGSTRALSSTSAGAAQVEFDPRGEVLVVSEKATNKILTFEIGKDDLPGNAIVNNSVGATPFGFEFTERGVLIVSEAFGGAPGASAASSYRIRDDGQLVTQSASVATTQTAACWVVITPNNRFAYVTNTGSNTITGYRVGSDGALARLDATGVTATTQAAPIDAALSDGGRLLFTLNATAHSISAFAVKSDGSLSPLGATAGLPVGATGLLAR